jgi:hypothetical protein
MWFLLVNLSFLYIALQIIVYPSVLFLFVIVQQQENATKRQTIIYKTQQRKLTMEQQESH